VTDPTRRGGHPAANPAAIYDYLLGGKNNFPADRKAASRLIKAKPDLLGNVRANRAFLRRAVRFLAAGCGISQFLDIGTGLPTTGNTHEVAQQVNPSCRVVYVDNDPVVLASARALLTSTPEGATDYVEADLRDPGTILAGAGRTLDLARPVAVTLLGVLYQVPDPDDPYRAVRRLAAAAAPGSFVAISHPASDIHAGEAARAAALYEKATGIPQTNRSRQEVARFFDGLELIEPGVVPLNQWRPDPDTDTGTVISSWAGIGRKQP
jgi:O-methyltransferase involved in polyketide biosynthesis